MNDKKSNPNRIKKEKIVAKLSDKAKLAKGFVFTNYQGLTHKQIEGLKKAVKQQDADFVVAKNSLLLRSLAKYESHLKSLTGPTATLFIYKDIIMPLKALAKTIKELTLPIIKLAIIEDKVLTSDDVIKLSALPPRDVLIAQFIGMMKTPLYGFHRALSWNMQKLVMTLRAIENKKA